MSSNLPPGCTNSQIEAHCCPEPLEDPEHFVVALEELQQKFFDTPEFDEDVINLTFTSGAASKINDILEVLRKELENCLTQTKGVIAQPGSVIEYPPEEDWPQRPEEDEPDES